MCNVCMCNDYWLLVMTIMTIILLILVIMCVMKSIRIMKYININILVIESINV